MGLSISMGRSSDTCVMWEGTPVLAGGMLVHPLLKGRGCFWVLVTMSRTVSREAIMHELVFIALE